jgi:hypothetical protein
MPKQNKISPKRIIRLQAPEQQDGTQYAGHQFYTCKNTIKKSHNAANGHKENIFHHLT